MKYRGYVIMLYDIKGTTAAMFESTEELMCFFPGRTKNTVQSCISKALHGVHKYIRDENNRYFSVEKVFI